MEVYKKLTYVYYFGIIAGLSLTLCAQTPRVNEVQMKALYLFNFTQFTEWPENNLKSDAAIVVGIIGVDPFGSMIDEIISGEVINGHPLVVKRFRHVQEINHCHILYFNGIDVKECKNILQMLKGKSILTVGADEHFIENGGMVNFSKINNKIHFQINPEAVKNSNLALSSKLLKLAKIVVPSK